MIYGTQPRAFVLHEGRWCNIYTIRFYTQVDIFGENVKMVSATLTKNGKEIHDFPVEKLEAKRPKTTKRKPKQEGA